MNKFIKFIAIITVPPNMHWFDVTEEYFNAYRQHMDPVFKAADGCIAVYEEMKVDTIYHKPIYTLEHRDRVSVEARNFVMRSNKDLGKVKTQLQAYGRSLLQVSVENK